MSDQARIAESGQIAEQSAPVVSGPSPRPWRIVSVSIFGEYEIIDAAQDGVAGVYAADGRDDLDPMPGRANAAFIVRAVNSHDALVKALEFALEVTDEDLATGRFSMTERGRLAYEMARATLTSAREVQS